MTRIQQIFVAGCTAIALLTLASCEGSDGRDIFRGGTSTSPPIHLVLDMDFQPKVKTQSKSEFFGNGRGMRMPVTDINGAIAVVPRGSLADPKLTNKAASGGYVTSNPVAISREVLERGQHNFDLYCSICHGYTGRGGNGVHGNGLVGRRWPVAIPSFHFDPSKSAEDNRVSNLPDGEYYEVIANGKGTMPAYGARIAAEDRWAIVHYIRVLQSLSR